MQKCTPELARDARNEDRPANPPIRNDAALLWRIEMERHKVGQDEDEETSPMSKKAVEPKSQEVTGCVSCWIEGKYVLFPSESNT